MISRHHLPIPVIGASVGLICLLLVFAESAFAQPSQLRLSFRRGDTNTDGEVDLTDATATLNWLFLGGTEPDCLDATDSNDDGNVDITDGVYTLNFLFLGGAQIPTPGHERCGLDPTADVLSCLAYEPCICGGILGAPCSEGQICDLFPIDCDGADLQGICLPLPAACPEIFSPVCGCDGVTYGNDCERLQSGVQKAYDGPCGTPLSFRTLERGTASGAAVQTSIFRDQASWDAFWAAHGRIFFPPSDAPTVDFETEMAVVVVQHFTSGGYHVKLDSVLATNAGIWASVTLVEPSKDCGTTDAETQPFHFVAVDRSDGDLFAAVTSVALCCDRRMDVVGVGPCDAVLGFAWTGQGCEAISGCECEGDDCDELFEHADECEAAYSGCPVVGEPR